MFSGKKKENAERERYTVRRSVLLSSNGVRVQSCEVKGCVGRGMMLYDGGVKYSEVF